MSKIDEIRSFIRDKAENFGAKIDVEFNKPYVERNNTGPEALKDNGAYFGFIHPDEENSGPFHDFSLTIFPTDHEKPWLICLGVGSLGFKNDYELATFPGLRRLFSRLVDKRGFCKSNFSDIETSLPKSITANPQLQHIKNSIKTYTKVLPVCQIVDDPLSVEGKKVIAAFVAGYAKLRDWPSNKEHRAAISDAVSEFSSDREIEEESEILNLVKERKYVVLQGPPGTGKTRAAKLLAAKLEATTFFTQFHAETTYSDFIYGIRPKIDSESLSYKEHLGVFAKAVKYAKDSGNKTLLIIDEINRANLSNVLGPIFYLFEYKQDTTDIKIEITPDLDLNKLPDNFFVVATMNTADRSLAVVDFALRRRFAWYTLKPKALKTTDFYKEDYSDFEEIFEWYANSNELTLQPGHGYFIASSAEAMRNRIRYELYPLIREYLQEGLLSSAKEEFNNYFKSRIGVSLFE
jgi:5-methylcytosine-specific restriction enzyme B